MLQSEKQNDTNVTTTVDDEDCNEDNNQADLDDEQLSNATSFNQDNDFMLHDFDNDDTAIQTSEAAKQGKEKPYNEDGSERVKLEVGQMFNIIYHL
ncbi:hypothetical protein ACOSP7_012649 [Xanthoceras sorbifolium]